MAATCAGVACFGVVGMSSQKPRALMISAGVSGFASDLVRGGGLFRFGRLHDLHVGRGQLKHRGRRLPTRHGHGVGWLGRGQAGWRERSCPGRERKLPHHRRSTCHRTDGSTGWACSPSPGHHPRRAARSRRGPIHIPSAACRRRGHGRSARRGRRARAGRGSCAASGGCCRYRDARTASLKSGRSRRRRAAGAGRRNGSAQAAHPGCRNPSHGRACAG